MSRDCNVSETHQNAQNELGMLDVAVIIAENWLLLSIAPILAALLAFGIFSQMEPRTFDSVALMRINSTEAAMLQSAKVLNPAIVGSNYLEEYGGSFSRARQDLAEDLLAIAPENETDLYRVRVRYKSAEGAQELLEKIVSSLIENSAPTPSEANLLVIKIEQTKRSISELEFNLDRINRLAKSMETGSTLSGSTIGELGQALVAFVANIEDRHSRVFQLEDALKGSVSKEDIIQPPTLPDSPNPTGVMVRSILVAFGVGLAVLMFSFLAAGWKNASQSADGLQKINKIRRAFWIKPKSV